MKLEVLEFITFRFPARERAELKILLKKLDIDDVESGLSSLEHTLGEYLWSTNRARKVAGRPASLKLKALRNQIKKTHNALSILALSVGGSDVLDAYYHRVALRLLINQVHDESVVVIRDRGHEVALLSPDGLVLRYNEKFDDLFPYSTLCLREWVLANPNSTEKEKDEAYNAAIFSNLSEKDFECVINHIRRLSWSVESTVKCFLADSESADTFGIMFRKRGRKRDFLEINLIRRTRMRLRYINESVRTSSSPASPFFHVIKILFSCGNKLLSVEGLRSKIETALCD